MSKANRTALLSSIAGTIVDYRQGEVPKPDPSHVDRWIGQFDPGVQEPILAELDSVLKKTYISRQKVEEFLSSLLTESKLAGSKPRAFWKTAKFLSIQGGGNSQREMLVMFDDAMETNCALRVDQCGSDQGAYIYLDDVIFTGNRIKSDLVGWINSSAPAKAKLHVVVIAYHRGGQYYARAKIEEACAAAPRTSTSRGGAGWKSRTESRASTTRTCFAPLHFPPMQ